MYNTYGELPNSDLLRRYGYVRFGRVSNDLAEISIELILDVAARHLNEVNKKKRIDYLIEVDEGEDGDDILENTIQIPGDAPSIPTEALMLTYVMTLSPPEFRALKKEGIAYLPTVSRKVFKTEEQQELWVEILKQKMNGYNTDIVTDENLYLDESITLSVKSAIEVRLSEKRILTKALNSVKNWKITPIKKRRSAVASDRPSKRMK